MYKKVLNQAIYLKEYIYEKEYKDISQLNEIINLNDKANLKLELDYKLNKSKHSEIGLKNINDFFYYINDVLISYLGISNFGKNVGEITGMTAPNFRRNSIFKKLFELAIKSCSVRNFDKLLLLSDGESISGNEFIKAVGGIYDFSEYRMKLVKKSSLESLSSIYLRKAEIPELKEIWERTPMLFTDSQVSYDYVQENENINKDTFIVELKDNIIGKIGIDYNDNSAFIFGFRILPTFRGKGYGKSTLKETLRLLNKKDIHDIELDVECKNNTALSLYKSCGFEEKSVMNYYKYNI